MKNGVKSILAAGYNGARTVSGTFSYKKTLVFRSETFNMILAVKNLGKSLDTSVFGTSKIVAELKIGGFEKKTFLKSPIFNSKIQKKIIPSFIPIKVSHKLWGSMDGTWFFAKN